MSRRRFIADEVEANCAALTGAHAEHLSRVLRARVGQQFDIALGEQVRRGTIISITDDRVNFELGESVAVQRESSITLALAIIRFDRFEWAAEKCTELAVSRLIPVIARRTDVHLAKGATKRVERWRRIAREASEQSRRAAVPEIADPLKLRDYLAAEKSQKRIVLSENETDIQLRDVVEGDDIALAVGPEGGWTIEELHLFGDFGWKAASLGSTILRAETAAVAALAIAQTFSS